MAKPDINPRDGRLWPARACEGVCCICKRPLGWYDSKFVERDDPRRIKCVDCPPSYNDLTHDDCNRWAYYTDG